REKERERREKNKQNQQNLQTVLLRPAQKNSFTRLMKRQNTCIGFRVKFVVLAQFVARPFRGKFEFGGLEVSFAERWRFPLSESDGSAWSPERRRPGDGNFASGKNTQSILVFLFL
ncbi:MAG: hypothetical protein ACRCZO_00175, partial [Cetobacterium sp.]